MNVLNFKLMVQNVIKHVHFVLVVIEKEFVLHAAIMKLMEMNVIKIAQIVQEIKDV